jgi:hypothetical protein
MDRTCSIHGGGEKYIHSFFKRALWEIYSWWGGIIQLTCLVYRFVCCGFAFHRKIIVAVFVHCDIVPSLFCSHSCSCSWNNATVCIYPLVTAAV